MEKVEVRMKVSVNGMLKNACANTKKTWMGYYQEGIRQFVEHLKMLKDNPELHEEFFKTYEVE